MGDLKISGLSSNAIKADIDALKKQNTNRNLTIGGFMVLGATAGFILARQLKWKTTGKVLSTLIGSVAFGMPVILLTQKKHENRKVAISEKEKEFEFVLNKEKTQKSTSETKGVGVLKPENLPDVKFNSPMAASAPSSTNLSPVKPQTTVAKITSIPGIN